MFSEVLEYYSKPGAITNLDKYKTFTDWLTNNPTAIYQVVQGLIVHDSWVGDYGESYNENHEYSQKTAYMEDLLDKILEIDGSNLAIPRHPRDRVIACCREFATLMCAFLRAKKIPARSRCGFALYFGWNGIYEDHWICEYWNGDQWLRCDPQLDPLQQSSVINWALKGNDIKNKMNRIQQFNPYDLKCDEFITAGEAWKLCREGNENPEHFGISSPIRPEWGIDSLFGLWFIRGQLLRDFAALNKVETVPYLVRICKGLDWKPWHLVYAKDSELTDEELSLLDKIADLTTDVDTNFYKIREAYLTNKDLTVPDEIISR
ncbi:transglutaminase-like domain-containing protein [Clostridium oryzae]|uniref:Transglutaminase-like superfamily protein n=1 Tax=Clostridium oryzae TaxID=1450648 RepID=A0A1V4I881_9CLOT|nr:transglutaminase-like domain-containing protein [Clostridium oryzae]OPJ56166.1 transglutaminase-like superfamily protein [Clostridium oryzae]